jgi:tetratricopeptide (TPR) repeat protein
MYVLAKRQLDQLLSTGKIGADFDKGVIDPSALYIKATHKIDQGDYQGAIKDFAYLVALQPDYDGNYNNRGIAYSRLGQHGKAADDFSKVIELKPNNGEGYFNRAIEYIALKDRPKAIQDLQAADQLFRKKGDTASNQRVLSVLKTPR